MRNTSTSKRLLKYQKAKAKLIEYNVPHNNYPSFPQDSNELSYSTIYALSAYAESIINNDTAAQKDFEEMLEVSSQYFEAAAGAKDRSQYDEDFLLSAAVSYFLLDDFGSSKVVSSILYNVCQRENNTPQDLLMQIFHSLLLGKKINSSGCNSEHKKILESFQDFFQSGEHEDKLMKYLDIYRSIIYDNNEPMQIYYIDLLYAVIIRSIEKSTWKLLPKYSNIRLDEWREYLNKENSMKMLWPSQQLIGMNGILQGSNAVVQLPTGVGKTKSIELIIRSSFLAGRSNTALIVAPLRALCNEITIDMQSAFDGSVEINQFSDILENDFSLVFSEQQQRILICTPEKLNYIIHHQIGFLDQIGLMIFDEGHMFDDGNRGAAYELLLTEIKQELDENKQIVLLSAVLSNAEQIKEWLIGDDGVLASDPKIKSTPKAVGFASGAKDLHYYTDDSQNEDFFVPRCIDQITLNKKKKERVFRLFPELTSSRDIGIYFASKLCHNGGVAVFVGNANSILPTLRRINDLNSRAYDFGLIRASCDTEELSKIKNLISVYYGNDHDFIQACDVGFVPHYSSLPNGIRLAVEYALRERLISVVVCTSTLAQGVNIPIKYLLMTSFRVSTQRMSIRSFQNLMGRTARSGMYTEGSVIITDPKLFDQKEDRKHGGNYRWNDQINMFNPNAAEPCGSSILSLVQDLPVDYKKAFSGVDIARSIIEYYNSDNCFTVLQNELLNAEGFIDSYTITVTQAVSTYESILRAIENYFCFGTSNLDTSKENISASDICSQTLAYAMANDEQKKLLLQIFAVVSQKVLSKESTQIAKYSRAMIGLDLSDKIEQWIESRKLMSSNFCENELLDMIIDLYICLFPNCKGKDSLHLICSDWILGKSFCEISGKSGLSISDIEAICSKNISYELSFLAGNIIDLLESDSKDNTELLSTIQRKLKYGVSNETAVSICEKVFNERYLANKMAGIIGNNAIQNDSIIGAVKVFKPQILEFLLDYPSYFTSRIKWLMSRK